jgi:dihydroflavonol-4-reductase
MTVLVTGATGYIGSRLTEELVKINKEVDALVRRPERVGKLNKLGVGIVTGDVTDPSSFKGKLGKYDTIYHLANVYDFWAPDNSIFYKVNVQGTKDLLQEAKASGVGKVIYTSTVEAIGMRKGEIGNEETTHCGYYPAEYSRTKYLGLCEAMKAFDDGVPVITVMPGATIGPGDVKATGQFIMSFLNHKLPGLLFPDCTISYGYLNDVVKGHILAAEKGKAGQKYIIANGNYSTREFFGMVSEVSGIPMLEKTVPPVMISMLSNMQMLKASFTKRPPQIPKGLVRLMKNGVMADNSRSIKELGMTYTPIKDALRETVEWYRAQGMAPSEQKL